MYFAGIDIGSTMTKVAIINGFLVSSFISASGPEHRRLADHVMQEAMARAGLTFKDISFIVATGYGRINVPFANRQITEITCHARAAALLFPTAHTVIDIGGQDCKAMRLNNGKLVDFVMNDKCAAGTGRFLEIMADSLNLRIEELGEVSLQSVNPASIADTCTVFAEREVVSRLAEGVPVPDLVAGIHRAMANRIYGLANRIIIEKDVVITGGGAKNRGLIKALEERIGFPVLIPEEPLLMGAIGAALLGKEIYQKNSSPIKK